MTLVGLGEISIFDILMFKTEHKTAINQARRFTWRRILRFALFTQFYRHQPRFASIYRDFTVTFMVWTRSLIFITDLDEFQINVPVLLANNLLAIRMSLRHPNLGFLRQSETEMIKKNFKMWLTSMNSLVLFQCVLLRKCSATITACIWSFTLKLQLWCSRGVVAV